MFRSTVRSRSKKPSEHGWIFTIFPPRKKPVHFTGKKKWLIDDSYVDADKVNCWVGGRFGEPRMKKKGLILGREHLGWK